MDSGDLFDLSFITADRRRGIGGDYKEVKGYRKVQRESIPDTKPGKLHRPKRELKRDPNHGAHKTINIYDPGNPNIHIYKVHYRLFDRFNGKTVIQ